MIALTLGEIAAIVGGALHEADPATVVTGAVEYDSRRIGRGGLFVAFAGERVDGHDYVAAARAKGAVAALVQRPVPGPRIEIDDPLQALAALARTVLARRPEITVVGVTGSSGKSSTKDLLAAVLGRLGPTVAPPGSPNNELGLPHTVLQIGPDTAYLVLEMGARNLGHITYLTEIAPPRVGIVLNVGHAHLGEFGSQVAIAQAKGELVEALDPDGVAVLNADDPLVTAMAARTRARVLRFGRGAEADVRAGDVDLDELGRAGFTLIGVGPPVPVRLALSGAHHVGNALAAAAVGHVLGLGAEEIAAALSGAAPVSRWRMELAPRADGVLVVNDAYNANPESMSAAIAALAALAAPRRAAGGRAVAVLGPMAELGRDADGAHAAVGREVASAGVEQLVVVGEAARPLADAATLEGSWSGETTWVPDIDAAVAALRARLRPGDVVLIKASRAAGLERVAAAIADDRAAAEGAAP